MKKFFAIISLLVLAPFSVASENAGCASASSWQDAGFNVASKGKPVTQYYSMIRTCESMPSETDEAQFVKGYMAGIENYCTYENGFEVGNSREEYPNVCPASMDGEFKRGYQAAVDKNALKFFNRGIRNQIGPMQLNARVSTPASLGFQ